MTPSMLFLALTGLGASLETKELAWRTDYAEARKEGAGAEKPLVVILGKGRTGWRKFASDGGLNSKAKKLLASQFTPVYVDTTTKAGKQLARAFAIKQSQGIVISDRTGDLQAFRHEGDLTNAKLVKYLHRYGDPEYVVRTTETNPHRKRARSLNDVQGFQPTFGGCPGGRCH